MTAPVNKIIPFSTVDGPGNRTSIFLQGCNMDCKYCHNPETRGICIHCGKCVDTCPVGALSMEAGKVRYFPEKCIHCDTCIQVCPYDSSPKIQNMTPEEVFIQVQKQIPFIRGITVSGGECTQYPDFLTKLFRLCKEAGLSTLLDTNGTLDFSKNKDLLQVTDGVMLDIKAFNPEQHKILTKMDNQLILKNAVFLAKIGKLQEVRTVISDDLLDVKETLSETARMLKPFLEIHDINYKIIAYRPFGVRKQYANFKIPSLQYLESLAEIVKNEGFKNITIT